MVKKDDLRTRPKLPPEYGVYVEPSSFFFSFVIGVLASILLNAFTRR